MVHPLNTASITEYAAPLYNEEERANARWQVYLQAQGTAYEGGSYVEVLLNVGLGYLPAIQSSHPYLYSAIRCLRTTELAMQITPKPMPNLASSFTSSAAEPKSRKPHIYESILSAIRDYIGAYGAVESDQIFLEVLRQVSIEDEPITESLVERHLDYLLSLSDFRRVENEFGVHYGHASDF